MKPKVAIVGNGSVGNALLRGLERAGYQTRMGEKGKSREAMEWADAVVLAVPFTALDSVLKEVGTAADGKLLVDVTNALTQDMQPALGFSTSGAEELQKKASTARVVKAFNMVFAKHMDSGRLNDQQLTLFAAGDDEEARETVLQMARDIGFDAVNAGPLRNARWLESLGFLNIQLGYVLGNGPATGFRYLH
ncbi:MAG TPA: NAD(P)-binding domain-containing protein [Thermoanaerobaculia bacterium]